MYNLRGNDDSALAILKKYVINEFSVQLNLVATGMSSCPFPDTPVDGNHAVVSQ